MVETVMQGVKMKHGQGFEEIIVDVEIIQFIDRLLNAMSKLIQVNLVSFFIIVFKSFPKVIMIQENKMQRVLCNLLSNSIKHSYKSSVNLKFSTITATEYSSIPEYHQQHVFRWLPDLPINTNIIMIEVLDYGLGISADKLANVFQEQETDASNQNWDGLGLGMSIVKGICTSMNIKMFLNSKEKQ